MHHRALPICVLLTAVLVAGGATATPAAAGEWPNWRGAQQNGTAPDTGLIANWSLDGTNLVWKDERFTGRSTPVVFDGRACANGRVGEETSRQEQVVCWDAASGERLWEHRFNVFHSTVPWNRVGWANLTGDPETGYLYAQGVGGTFLCLDREGEVVWQRSLVEDFGFFSGYGGRTQTPVVDGEHLYVTFVSGSWGEWSAPRHRTHAFAKKTGELLWVSTPGEYPHDMNNQSTPIVMTAAGRRLLVQANGDGSIHAIDANTGEPIWTFRFSKRGMNTSVVASGDTVYAMHSEENVDSPNMGRVVAIDPTGTGDVTASHERWRTPVSAGYTSPALHDGRLYVIDNSANLHALDAGSGEILWEHSLGTVGKGSPVWADGKLYATEVNGKFHILEVGADGARQLDSDELSIPGGERYAEIYGSPAVAYGRIYFTTEGGMYCLGDPEKPFPRDQVGTGTLPQVAELPPAGSDAAVATIRVVPADVEIGPGEKVTFTVHAFDEKGRPLGTRDARWSLDGIAGRLEGGAYMPAADSGIQVGHVVAEVGESQARVRVRVFPALPLTEDFDGVEPGGKLAYQLGARGFFAVEADEESGNRYLVKSPSPRGIHRQNTFIGPDHWRDYTIQADLRGTKTGRKVPDMGLINSGYTMDLMGAHQQIQVRSWGSELRMAQQVPLSWEPDRWYTMKMRVDHKEGRAFIFGKVWPQGEPEPREWSIAVSDPLPIPQGSPGLYGYSPTPIHYDNVEVTRNR